MTLSHLRIRLNLLNQWHLCTTKVSKESEIIQRDWYKTMQFSQHRRFARSSLFSIDFFTGADRSETLSQAISRTYAESSTVPGEDDQEALVLFGSLRGNVVGLRYYTGVVNKREMVSLVREPQNPYDKNAVQVANVYGHQVGHIKRELAAPMAYIMDNKLAKVEGIVPFGATNTFAMPVQLFFWGQKENKAAVMNKLGQHGFRLGPTSEGFGGKSAKASGPTIDKFFPPLRGSPAAIPLTREQLQNVFDKLFDNLMEEKIQEMEPAEAVGTPLLPHQKQALAWMVLRENNNDLPPFWEQKNNLYFNVLTNFAVKEKPEKVHGGILADDMGLGKTLTTIALILSNFHNGRPLPTETLSTENALAPGSSASKERKERKRTRKEELEKSTVEDRSVKSAKDPVPAEASVSSSRAKRSKVKVKYTYSSDSEGSDSGVSPKKKSGFSALKDDADFAAALEGFIAERPLQKKAPKKGVPKTSFKGSRTETKIARATLIICPLSVLSNWMDQFEQHVRADVSLNVYLYYGSDRSRDASFLAKQDVVLTTYNVLAVDYGNKNSSPLHRMEWLRVVLDEGHTIRNPNALQSRAVLDLTAQRRWILTGTPIQNSLKDVWTLIAFLKLKPFDVKEWWNRIIQRPVTMGDKDGLQHLQALIKGITLRRTKASTIKGKPVVELPQRNVRVQHVTLTEDERRVYEAVQKEGRSIIRRYFREGTVLTNYADVLAILVRLRQVCCHPGLLRNSPGAAGPTEDATPSELREKLINKINMVLNSGSDEECAICLESLRLPVITQCAHVYCKPCICEVIRAEQNAKCPLCRGEIKVEELVEYPGEKAELESEEAGDGFLSSSKVDALMIQLQKIRDKDPNIKSLVVSQFTKFLSLIEIPLRERGFSFTRLDGSMNQKRRVAALQAFQNTNPGTPTILLLSLKAGGVGLNLTAASRIFLMDPAWNPAAEDQCFDRCHRIGQKRDVVITKFIVKNSVEENMIKIQKKKRDLVAKAFGLKNLNERKQARIEEIKTLMEI
uniref:Helicase like transcription factor n=1 Tax=Lepisosteus oculatus TaxID=7918 RepID=W5MLL7_LEPOC|nr:PREDICTED: helicase-like transcription factor isoform X1 [Lepisosteus oculatus]